MWWRRRSGCSSGINDGNLQLFPIMVRQNFVAVSQDYIRAGQQSLDQVVDVMAAMQWLYDNTTYHSQFHQVCWAKP